ncbi:MAG: Mur ligase domain-containing protein, partial [Solirubrobacteraceae bacterium]
MRDWDARHLAAAAGATLVRAPSGATGRGATGPPGPTGVSIDSRALAPGELFVGLRGERVDGGDHAAQALAEGAWGVLVAPEHAHAAAEATGAAPEPVGGRGAVLAHEDPLAGLQALARAWRRELRSRGAMVVAITGSTGKTSTKDILAA